jgi:hypothetical protein
LANPLIAACDGGYFAFQSVSHCAHLASFIDEMRKALNCFVGAAGFGTEGPFGDGMT